MTACDHWNRVGADTRLLEKMHVQTHRLGLEWSRIEPQKGRFSQEAIEHYRRELILLRSCGIRPLVTLHHFAEPLWFIEEGGWAEPGNPGLFLDYARHVVERLGDLASDWVTFNEPNVYLPFGYILGCFPPGRHDFREARRIGAALIRTHVSLYRLIHETRRRCCFAGRTRVGAAMHLRVFEGLTPLGKKTAQAADYLFNSLFLEGMTTGRVRFPLSAGTGGRASRCADFIGINYYTRSIVEFAWDPRLYFHRFLHDDSLDKTDLGWDIYPDGIYEVCRRCYEKYRLPIFITENGISDRLDNRRPDFLVDHLARVARAVREGIPVERYYYWTLMDNFEWLDGEEGSFGLYGCDFRTQRRTPRGSAALYAQICKNRGVTSKMLAEFYTPRGDVEKAGKSGPVTW